MVLVQERRGSTTHPPHSFRALRITQLRDPPPPWRHSRDLAVHLAVQRQHLIQRLHERRCCLRRAGGVGVGEEGWAGGRGGFGQESI